MYAFARRAALCLKRRQKRAVRGRCGTKTHDSPTTGPRDAGRLRYRVRGPDGGAPADHGSRGQPRQARLQEAEPAGGPAQGAASRPDDGDHSRGGGAARRRRFCRGGRRGPGLRSKPSTTARRAPRRRRPRAVAGGGGGPDGNVKQRAGREAGRGPAAGCHVDIPRTEQNKDRRTRWRAKDVV